MIILKFGFEYGNDHSCVSSVNNEAIGKFGGYIINNEFLDISKDLSLRLISLCEEYQTSLNWEYPQDSSPWNQEQRENFSKRAADAYCDLVKQLGEDYNVIYDVFIPR